MSLEVCPMTLKEANAFVEQHHRHHKPVVGHKFSIGCTDGNEIVGVAIVGRPVSRHLSHAFPPAGFQACATFAVQYVGHKSFVAHRPCRPPSSGVQHRASIVGAICA